MLRDSELAAAECALDWARPGDVLGLLVHGSAARAEVLAMLGDRQARARQRSGGPDTAA
jgi:hypothetical protein